MTDVTPNPRAREARLYRRAVALKVEIDALLLDLRDNEGRASALGAQEDLSTLCLTLERKADGR